MKKVAKKFLLMLPLLICVFVSGFSFSVKSAHAYLNNQAYVISKTDNLDGFYYNGHYYAIFDKIDSWEEAKTYCEELGGHLATITTLEEYNYLLSKLSELSISSCWIGGTDSVNEGV